MTQKPTDSRTRFRGLIAYDGTNFHGFQIQPDVRTVEGELTRALAQLAGVERKVQGASRTDAGVHAYGQVIHFDYAGRLTAATLTSGLNAIASYDVRVMYCERVPADFHARHDAGGKLYRYDLWVDRIHNPLYRRHSLHVKSRLDIDAMRNAAQLLVGEHDFSSFRSSSCHANSPVLPLQRVDIFGKPPLVSIHVEGGAFLKYMVRTIAGTLIEVGRGKRPWPSITDLLALRDRTKAGKTSSANGLHLVYVRYPNHPWANRSPTLTANAEGLVPR